MPDKYRRRLVDLLLSFYKKSANSSGTFIKEDFFDDSNYQKFYRKIYFEIFRHLGFTESCINKYLSKKINDNKVKALMVLGATQILYMNDIPDYAAINETVNLTPFNKKNFINAILRNISRDKEQLLTEYNIYKDFPDWFVNNWSKRLGSSAELNEFLKSLNETPNFFSVDLNTLSLVGYEHKISKNRYTMDSASFYIPLLTENLKPLKILDACAAPGGKTLILSLLHPYAEITAVEKNPKRLNVLKQNMSFYNAKNVKIINTDLLSFINNNRETFDLILLDAPCTALGTIRKHPEVRWLRTPENIKSMAKYQNLLLNCIPKVLARNGFLLYSVCSLEPEEGIEQIEKFFKTHDNFMPIPAQTKRIEKTFFYNNFFYSLPHKTNTDGFFASLSGEK